MKALDSWRDACRAVADGSYRWQDKQRKRQAIERVLRADGTASVVVHVTSQANDAFLGVTPIRLAFAGSSSAVAAAPIIAVGLRVAPVKRSYACITITNQGREIFVGQGSRKSLVAFQDFYLKETMGRIGPLMASNAFDEADTQRLRQILLAEQILVNGAVNTYNAPGISHLTARNLTTDILYDALAEETHPHEWTGRILRYLVEDYDIALRGLSDDEADRAIEARIAALTANGAAQYLQAAIARLPPAGKEDSAVAYRRVLSVLDTPRLHSSQAGIIHRYFSAEGAPSSDPCQLKEVLTSKSRSIGADVAALRELEDLVGLAPVKEAVHDLVALVRVQRLRQQHGKPGSLEAGHLVFVGNPGTGKTTVARLIGRCFAGIGLLQRGHLVETSRGDLVAGYVGQTAPKTREVFNSAKGGVLFIDEAYGLVKDDRDGFGLEALEELMKLVEDHRDDTVVILAGYHDEMKEFLSRNPGLRSRFSKVIDFPDYDDDELLTIFKSLATAHEYRLTPEAEEYLRAYFATFPRGKEFGNGRVARSVFNRAVELHARRVSRESEPSPEALSVLRREDIPEEVHP